MPTRESERVKNRTNNLTSQSPSASRTSTFLNEGEGLPVVFLFESPLYNLPKSFLTLG
jgi:hypothetical protein